MAHGGRAPCSLCERAKLDAYWKRYGSSSSSEDSDAQKTEVESNILIQFRSSASLIVRA